MSSSRINLARPLEEVRVRKLAGLPMTISTLEAASLRLNLEAKSDHDGVDVHLLNAYSVYLADRDEIFRKCLREANINYPDGKPLSLVTRLSKDPLSQVRGPSLFERTMADGVAQGTRHYLLGSSPETLRALTESLRRRHPGVKIVGTLSPPYRALTREEIAQQDSVIRHSAPDIVWVGLGTPKQDYEASRLAREAGFYAVAVGAAFDFSAGTKKEAPDWISRVGLEWAYRFASEPRRLWKRYVFGNIGFLAAVARGAERNSVE